jgi:molybdopterin-containing oxidoreductase family membrane subunit
MSKNSYYIWIVILGLVAAIGVFGLILQNTEGLHLTGASDLVPWGLYIPSGAFFVGLSAGTTIIGLLIHGLGRDDYAPIGTRSIVVGLSSLAAGMLFVAADVGVPIRMLLIPWVHRNLTSPFVYSALSYYLFGLILLIELYYAVKITRGNATDKDKRVAKWLAVGAFLFAVLVLASVSGFIFASVKSRELWHSSLVPPHFVVSALVTGTAAMIIGTLLTAKTAGREILSKITLNHMGKLLVLFLAVNIFFDVYDLIWLNFGATPEAIEALSLLTGTYAPTLGLHLGGLIIALLILISKKGKTVLGLSVASILALIGVAAYRFNLIIVGQLVPLLPDLPVGTYLPSLIEISVVAGVIAIGLILYNVLTRFFPMDEKEGTGASKIWNRSK